ncbi:MAG: NAD-dependent epimerase/dehydratase family protein [Pleurocapsa sp. SU_196_0]|nr:NAD-dependent epimerase/dehydratase family protein [Pleurocapsa sp. SU_196_0]
MSDDAQVLLLGAAGFLGAHVRRALEAQGARVTGVSRRDDGINRRLELSDPDAVRALLLEVRPSAIINCAGRTAGSLSELTRDNTLSVAHLLETVQAELPEARFVQFGSAAEYGPVQPDTPVTEDTPARPEGAYGITKLAATLLVERETEAGRLEGVVLRVFNPVVQGCPRRDWRDVPLEPYELRNSGGNRASPSGRSRHTAISWMPEMWRTPRCSRHSNRNQRRRC